MNKTIDMLVSYIVSLNETKRNETKRTNERNTMQEMGWNITYVLTSNMKGVKDI